MSYDSYSEKLQTDDENRDDFRVESSRVRVEHRMSKRICSTRTRNFRSSSHLCSTRILEQEIPVRLDPSRVESSRVELRACSIEESSLNEKIDGNDQMCECSADTVDDDSADKDGAEITFDHEM